tara:strand:- start:65 stop:184 length:120 start_codon:yes stop_codon:yes gene_type:complete
MSNKIRSDAMRLSDSQFKAIYKQTKAQALKKAGLKPIKK